MIPRHHKAYKKPPYLRIKTTFNINHPLIDIFDLLFSSMQKNLFQTLIYHILATFPIEQLINIRVDG